MRNILRPKPAPPAFGEKDVVPEERASSVTILGITDSDKHADSGGSLISKIIFHWLSPLLNVGFSRPLEIEGAPLTCPRLLRIYLKDIQTYGNCPTLA